MKELSDAARGAKSIKAELAKAFPVIKFSVRSENYSGGDSINVSWNCGPTTKQVEKIVDKYSEGSFNGMIDLYEYDSDSDSREFRAENGSAKYVMTNRSFPNGTHERVAQDLCNLQGIEFTDLHSQRNLLGANDCDWLSTHVNRLLHETAFAGNDADYSRIVFESQAKDQTVERDVRTWCVIEFDAAEEVDQQAGNRAARRRLSR